MTGAPLEERGMYMPSLDQILSRIVERKGFTVQGADTEGLLARKSEETLLVAWKTDAALTPPDIQMFTAALEQVQATRGILVAARGTEPSAREAAANDKRLEIWAESRLVVETGETYVKDALEAHTPAPIVAAPMTATIGGDANRATNVSGAAPTASRPPAQRFPSLISTAASLTSGDNRGAAYYMPSKPKTPAPAATGGASLNYAWGGVGNGTTVDPGVAQIRNGRRPTTAQQNAPAPLPEHRDVEIVSRPRKAVSETPAPLAPAPIKPSVLVASEDVELITTPRKRAPAPEPAIEPAPVAAAPEPATTVPVEAPKQVEAPKPEPRPVTRTEVVETEEYEIISTPRRSEE